MLKRIGVYPRFQQSWRVHHGGDVYGGFDRLARMPNAAVLMKCFAILPHNY